MFISDIATFETEYMNITKILQEIQERTKDIIKFIPGHEKILLKVINA